MRRTHRTLALALAGAAALMHAPSSWAQPPYGLGQRLTQEQLAAVDTRKAVDINGRSYRLLSTTISSQGLPLSMVVGRDGVVGQTFHEVLIAELPPEKVRQQFASVIAQATAVQFQDHANLSVLRFATLEQAVVALQKIRAAQPGVEAGLPITFSLPRPR